MSGHIHIYCGTCGERRPHSIEKSDDLVIVRCQRCNVVTHSQDAESSADDEKTVT